MSDQADSGSVSRKALDEDVSAILGVSPTLPFEPFFAQHSRRIIEGRQSRLKRGPSILSVEIPTNVTTERRHIDRAVEVPSQGHTHKFCS